MAYNTKMTLTEIEMILNKLKEKGEMVVYDLETTGFNKKTDRILQFSAMRVSYPDLKEIERENIYIKCPFEVDGLEATKVNGITDEILMEQGIDDLDAMKRILNIIHEDDIIGGFNNISFDDPFLEEYLASGLKEFKYVDSCDVFKIAKTLIPPMDVMNETSGKACYKLGYLCEHFNPEEKLTFHNSMDDVRATVFVFKNLLKLYNETMNADTEEESYDTKPETKSISSDSEILSMNLFNPSKFMKRIYVNTSDGAIYYDIMKNEWHVKNGTLPEEDLNALINKALKYAKVDKAEDLFEKFK